MAIEMPMMSTDEVLPLTNGVPINGVDHNDIAAHKPEKPTPAQSNGVVHHELNGATAPDLAFDSIEDTITSFKAGSFIIVLDAPTRENEGDLICAAEDLTPSKAAFMIRHTSGLICSPVSASIAESLNLPQMVPWGKNSEADGTAYTVSVDAVGGGMTTGISAYDRAMTCRKLSEPGAQPKDFRRPGHVFPLRAREGGVRERRGHTESTVEFCRLAGKREVGALCELVEEGEEVAEEDGVVRAERTTPCGGMMRGDGCLAFGRRWGIKVCTIEALVEYLERNEEKKMNI